MKAIVVDRNRPGRPLLWQEVADPSCGEDDVIVDVQATALNRADLLHREGNFPTTAGRSDLLGGEDAGRIREVGNAVQGWSIGDSVVCLTLGGGYAEQVRVPQRLL
ncbi:MAG TPA: alcohol dehydrogenase catalytic domain-containing protein, partial [Trueperaceae bacterium]|nr:alcohol dehydrogenase catalytic domain-containing protein [Trueperaceae bacterium]